MIRLDLSLLLAAAPVAAAAFILLISESPDRIARPDRPPGSAGAPDPGAAGRAGWVPMSPVGDQGGGGPLLGRESAYGAMLAQAGVFVSGASVLPYRDGHHGSAPAGTMRCVPDGPGAEAREHLGGFWVIEVPDLEAALDRAARAASSASSSTKLRPVLVLPG